MWSKEPRVEIQAVYYNNGTQKAHAYTYLSNEKNNGSLQKPFQNVTASHCKGRELISPLPI